MMRRFTLRFAQTLPPTATHFACASTSRVGGRTGGDMHEAHLVWTCHLSPHSNRDSHDALGAATLQRSLRRVNM
jgi:hypothetical protein